MTDEVTRDSAVSERWADTAGKHEHANSEGTRWAGWEWRVLGGTTIRYLQHVSTSMNDTIFTCVTQNSSRIVWEQYATLKTPPRPHLDVKKQTPERPNKTYYEWSCQRLIKRDTESNKNNADSKLCVPNNELPLTPTAALNCWFCVNVTSYKFQTVYFFSFCYFSNGSSWS